MRGKDNAFRANAGTDGITPAYAGKSGSRANDTAADEDHPRVCGEKYCCAACRSALSGSPPRMRGKD